MKANKILIFIALALFTVSCGNSEKAEGHIHETEEHEHECHEGHDEHDEHNHDEESNSEHNSNEIILKKSDAEAFGVKSITIVPTDFVESIKVSGQILSAQGDQATVAAPVSGIISFTNKNVSEGVAISKGSSIVYISSKNISGGDVNDQLRIAYEIAKREYERVTPLFKDKIVSEKEYNKVKQEYETATLAFQARGVKGGGVSAPISGYITNIYVKEGDYVEVGQPIVVISQNKRLMLRADMPERYYSSLSKINSANFKTSYSNEVYQLSQMNGRLLSSAKAQSVKGYLPFLFEFDNKAAFISGNYADVYLLGATKSNVLSVPKEALEENLGEYNVYVQLDEDGYMKRHVIVGASNGKNVEILSGLKSGDKVVVSGTTQVRIAAKSGAIPEGHSHNH